MGTRLVGDVGRFASIDVMGPQSNEIPLAWRRLITIYMIAMLHQYLQERCKALSASVYLENNSIDGSAWRVEARAKCREALVTVENYASLASFSESSAPQCRDSVMRLKRIPSTLDRCLIRI